MHNCDCMHLVRFKCLLVTLNQMNQFVFMGSVVLNAFWPQPLLLCRAKINTTKQPAHLSTWSCQPLVNNIIEELAKMHVSSPGFKKFISDLQLRLF